jgi:NADH:ubiquinone oxidoreductase subunit 2 (subunit N)
MLFATLIFLTVSGIIVFIAASGSNAARPGYGAVFGGVSLTVFAIAGLMAVIGWNDTGTYYGVLKGGPLAALAAVILCGIGALVSAGVMTNPDKYRTGPGEFFGFVIFTVVGGILMVSSSNLLVLYLGIELSSYCTYILVGYYRDDRYSNEAASKYFMLGAVASAFLLFGMSFVYGGSGVNLVGTPAGGPQGVQPGSLEYGVIGSQLAAQFQSGAINNLIWPGLAMILVGFGFKLALVPFHSWTPDAYQGAPTMVAALVSSAPKVAFIIALSSLLTTAFGVPPVASAWQNALIWLAILSMTIGNLQALQQRNIKRLLGYSSIAQLGYIAIGVAAGTSAGIAALILYIIGYAITNIGAFTTISALREAGIGEEVEDYAGLVRRSPMAAVLLTGFFMSLAGVPLLAGFLGKVLVFKSAVDVGLIVLAIVAVLNTVVAYFYYFRVIIQATLAEPRDPRPIELNPTALVVLSVALVVVVLLGVYPTPVLNAINAAVEVLPKIAAR